MLLCISLIFTLYQYITSRGVPLLFHKKENDLHMLCIKGTCYNYKHYVALLFLCKDKEALPPVVLEANRNIYRLPKLEISAVVMCIPETVQLVLC